MAAMKRGKEPEGEGLDLSATSMAGYYSEIDAIREKEFPALQGKLAELHTLGASDSRILQEQPISITRAQLYTPNLS